MSAQHTPNEGLFWRAGTMAMTKSDWAKLRNESITIVQDGEDVVAAVWAEDDADEERFARLIAAAPDMLATLKMMSGVDVGHDLLKAIDAAIAKAEGRV